MIEHCYEPYDCHYDFKRGKPLTAEQLSAIEADRQGHQERCESGGRDFANFLLPQWPCCEPTVNGLTVPTLDIGEAVQAVRPEWLRLFQNLQLSRHIMKVQEMATSVMPSSLRVW